MELSERYLEIFEKEGFADIYEQQDPAGTKKEVVAGETKKSIFVTDGSIIFDFGDRMREIIAPRRFDIPVDAPYTTEIGPKGWIAIVAEG